MQNSIQQLLTYKSVNIRWQLAAFLLVVSTGFLVISYFVIDLEFEKAIAYLLLYILFIFILGYFVFMRTQYIFEPINLFCAYYITIVLGGVYFVWTNFEKTEYLTTYSRSPITVFNESMIYCIIGLVSTISGYFLVRNKKKILIQFESDEKISSSFGYISPRCAY